MGTNYLIKIFIKEGKEGKPVLILTIGNRLDGYYSGAGVQVAHFLKKAKIQTSFSAGEFCNMDDLYTAPRYETLAFKFIGYLSQNSGLGIVVLPGSEEDNEEDYDYVYKVYFGGDEEEKKPEPKKKKKGGKNKKSQANKKEEEEKKQEKSEDDDEISYEDSTKLNDKKMTENIILKTSTPSEGDDKPFTGTGKEFLELYGKDYDHERTLEQKRRIMSLFRSDPYSIMMGLR